MLTNPCPSPPGKYSNQGHIHQEGLPVCLWVLSKSLLLRFRAARASALYNFSNGWEMGHDWEIDRLFHNILNNIRQLNGH